METSTYTLEAVNRLRRRAVRASQLPFLRFGDLGYGEWSTREVEPMRLLMAFPSLRLRDGFVLRAYLHYGYDGDMWAFRKGARIPDPYTDWEADRLRDLPADELLDVLDDQWKDALGDRLKDMPVDELQDLLSNGVLARPSPAGALRDFMEAIEGDGTPWSYLCASLFAREAREFGAFWHGISWGTNEFLSAKDGEPFYAERRHDAVVLPPDARAPVLLSPFDRSRDEWAWDGAKPAERRSQVTQDPGTMMVTFHTYSGLYRDAIYRHEDTYEVGNYRPRTDVAELATGAQGYLF